METTDRDQVVHDAVGLLASEWGISGDLAMDSMHTVATALDLDLTELAALVSASCRLPPRRRSERPPRRPLLDAGRPAQAMTTW